MTLKNPAADLVSALTSTTVGGVGLVSGQNLFSRQFHPLPMGLVVVFLNSGGQAPQPFLSPTASAYFQPTVQCLVYGMPGDDGFDTGETLARGVLGAIQQTIPSGYVSVVAQESSPAYVGVHPETQRHIWSINFTARYTA